MVTQERNDDTQFLVRDSAEQPSHSVIGEASHSVIGEASKGLGLGTCIHFLHRHLLSAYLTIDSSRGVTVSFH